MALFQKGEMMADTINVYNENQACDDCGKSPVTFLHWPPSLEGKEPIRLCTDCFRKRPHSRRKEDDNNG
jgi:hypothetical protein